MPKERVMSRGNGKAFSRLKLLPSAIDIGTAAIKLIQLAESKDGSFEIVRIDEEPYFALPRYDSVVNLKKTLTKLVTRNKVRGDCFFTIFTKDALFFNVVFPPMSDFELTAAVKFKVAQLKPFGLSSEQIFFKFIRLHNAAALGSPGQCRVLIVCIAQETIQKWVSLFENVGLRPVNIEVPPFSLVNLNKFARKKGLAPAKKEEVILWLNIGAEEGFIAIEKDEKLNFARSLALNYRKIVETVAQHCDVDPPQAQELVHNYGLSYWSPDKKIPPFFENLPGIKEEDKSEKVYYGLISILENLVVDIEHSFKYFSYQVTQSQVTKFDRVVLCGGGANLKNLAQFLSARLDVPVEQYNLFKLFRLAPEVSAQKQQFINMPLDFATAAGLAAGYAVNEAQRVNFLFRERSELVSFCLRAARKRMVQAAAVLFLGAVSFLGVQIGKAAVYKAKMAVLTDKVKEAKARLDVLQNKQLELSKKETETVGEKKLLEARLQLIKNSIRTPREFSAIFREVAKLLPQEIWVTELKYEEGKLILTGSTVNTDAISGLIKSIKESRFFAGADFSYTQKEPSEEVYKFEIVAIINTAAADSQKE